MKHPKECMTIKTSKYELKQVNMSRQEDFIDAGIAYRMEHGKPMCIAGSNLADVERDFNRVISFEAGCEHGYKYAVEKACKWLEIMDVNEYLKIVPGWGYVIEDEDAIKAFRKAMED